MNSAPTVNMRSALLRQSVQDLAERDKSAAQLKQISDTAKHPWHLTVGTRTITAEIPERGEDGAYIVRISGEALPLLKRRIDSLASQYHYHRITTVEEPVAFTLEWKGDDGATDASFTAYFLLMLCRLLSVNVLEL